MPQDQVLVAGAR